jgi:putative transposase
LAHASTIFGQVLKLVPRHEFERLAKGHHRGGQLRTMSRWKQFVALAAGQLSGRHSLRDIVATLQAQGTRLYHLGAGPVARSSLARLNAEQPHTLFEALFDKLAARCRQHAPGHRFRFTNKLYSFDASLIDLSVSLFPWAHFCKGKAAMKLHVGLDHGGHLPAFATVTGPHGSETGFLRRLDLPKGSICVLDKGFYSYALFTELDAAGRFFVTRAKQGVHMRVLQGRALQGQTPRAGGVEADETVQITGKAAVRDGLPPLRRIVHRDPETGKRYVFLTNLRHLAAGTIAALYQQRWQIELFFKWIKQNLKIRAFLGASKNAVLTQIWVALCAYLLLAYLKFAARLGRSLQHIVRLLQVNLFMRRDLLALLHGSTLDPPPKWRQNQLLLI